MLPVGVLELCRRSSKEGLSFHASSDVKLFFYSGQRDVKGIRGIGLLRSADRRNAFA